MIRMKNGAFATVLGIAVLWTGAATAGVVGFFSDLVNPDSAFAGFVGSWVIAGKGPSDIDHVVVTASSDQVRIQVFGRCENRICNWGTLLARTYSDRPESATVRGLSADYNLGYAMRHIALHRAQGSTLRFEMVTEFTDGSARHDYESSGTLAPMGTRPAVGAAPSAPAATTAAATPAAAASAGSPAAPAAEAMPVASASDVESARPAHKPWWDLFSGSEPAANAGPGDCFVFNTGQSYLAPNAGDWQVRDFLHTIQDFGPYRNAAAKALTVIGYYHLDEVCRIGRGSSNLAYYRATGEVPRSPMTAEDCIDVHPGKVEAVTRDDDWKVVDGNREIFDYGGDQANAAKAAGAIKALGLNRQCFFDRQNTALSYWLAQ